MSSYQHFVQCCEDLGISGAVPFLDRMITVDYLIANEDRHLNNFGALRNAETLEWIGMAPIYDSGSSLGYDKLPAEILSGQDITCKPFKNHHEEQLKLVSSFDWFKPEKLADVNEMIHQVCTGSPAERFIDEQRIRAISESVQRRIEYLELLLKTQDRITSQDTRDDVEENVAQSYT